MKWFLQFFYSHDFCTKAFSCTVIKICKQIHENLNSFNQPFAIFKCIIIIIIITTSKELFPYQIILSWSDDAEADEEMKIVVPDFQAAAFAA